MEPTNTVAGLAPDLVLGVGFAQERQGRAIGPRRGLDHMGDILVRPTRIVKPLPRCRYSLNGEFIPSFTLSRSPSGSLVKVAQVYAAELLMLLQVVDRSGAQSRSGLRSPRTGSCTRCRPCRPGRERASSSGSWSRSPQPVALAGPEIDVPPEPGVAPVLVPVARLLGVAEELDLHLLELARPERRSCAGLISLRKLLRRPGRCQRGPYPRGPYRRRRLRQFTKMPWAVLGAEVRP